MTVMCPAMAICTERNDLTRMVWAVVRHAVYVVRF